jgi:HPt (histidine-containing phosphotransfer) domain-containing protein
MYYITNGKNQIIAADEEFLNLLSIDDLTQIYTSLANDELSLEFGDGNSLFIKTSLLEETYNINKKRLHSLVGDLYQIELLELESLDISDTDQEEVTIGDDIFENLTDEAIEDEIDSDTIETLDIGDNLLGDEDIKSDIEDKIDISDDELFGLLLDDDNDNNEDEPSVSDTPDDQEDISPISEEDDLFGIDSGDVQNIIESDDETSEKELEPIVLDTKSLSKTIGISEDDYKVFLNEYISTAKSLENDINSNDMDKRNAAISTLSHLSSVLHIPVINDILFKLENDKDADFGALAKELYATVSMLSTDDSSDEFEVEAETEVKEDDSVLPEENKFDSNIVTDDIQPKADINNSEHKIDLSDVQAIHFDFSMEAAASELSLPVDLIEEFVHDFIEQAHEETEKMLTAYDEGDLDKVNKIGHLLKGTSSNLRIVPLADTLYKIQFCESLDELEPLIKDYWGHFLAFENHIKLRTN